MQVIQKIKQLAEARGWTAYTIPTLPTLETVCNTFGITLSQFFSEDDMISLSTDQAELLEYWSALTPKQRNGLLNFLQTFL